MCLHCGTHAEIISTLDSWKEKTLNMERCEGCSYNLWLLWSPSTLSKVQEFQPRQVNRLLGGEWVGRWSHEGHKKLHLVHWQEICRSKVWMVFGYRCRAGDILSKTQVTNGKGCKLWMRAMKDKFIQNKFFWSATHATNFIVGLEEHFKGYSVEWEESSLALEMPTR